MGFPFFVVRWKAFHSDGSFVWQLSPAKSEYSYRQIRRDKLSHVEFYCMGRLVLRLVGGRGKHFFYRRRVHQSFGSVRGFWVVTGFLVDNPDGSLGWEIFVIAPDGSVKELGEWVPGHSVFGPVVLLPEELGLKNWE